MRILQVNTLDQGGGAESVARALFRSLTQRGHDVRFAVGRKIDDREPRIFRVPNEAAVGPLRGSLLGLAEGLRPMVTRVPGVGRLRTWLDRVARPGATADWWHGREDYNYPGTAGLLNGLGGTPDLIHCHNLHGGYFDLRALPTLSRRAPVIMTLHDAWLLSGHCAHSFDCDRWTSGCGACPDLTIFPAIRRDATAENWQRKEAIYAASRVFLATPSSWLMERVRSSMLMKAAMGTRVIPNGVDTAVFRPGDRRRARAELALSYEANILIVVSNGLRHNRWRDFPMLRDALARLSSSTLCLCIGEEAPQERIGNVSLRFVPPVKSTEDLAMWYRAADIALYPSRVDTFPTAILEAMASGLPVVASAVGGIVEQVRDGRREKREPTGTLVPRGDSQAMAEAIDALIDDVDLRQRLGASGRRIAEERYTLDGQVQAYLDWYAEILDGWSPEQTIASARA